MGKNIEVLFSYVVLAFTLNAILTLGRRTDFFYMDGGGGCKVAAPL